MIRISPPLGGPAALLIAALLPAALLNACPAVAQSVTLFGRPSDARKLTDEGLQAIAGREDLAQLAEAQSISEVSSNRVGNNVQTGEVRIADNAFQNLSGLSILNVNSGNNVAINASMSVNISIAPAP